VVTFITRIICRYQNILLFIWLRPDYIRESYIEQSFIQKQQDSLCCDSGKHSRQVPQVTTIKLQEDQSQNKRPNFLVIGAQKSGTTWLHHFLKTLPDVYVPENEKELMFFDTQSRYDSLGMKGYLNYFADVRNEPVIGEVTPGYLWTSGDYPEWGPPEEFRLGIPDRIKAALGPDVKLVAILRNPVDRAISAFLHHRKFGRIQPDSRLEGRWLTARGGIVHMGFYDAHLAAFRERFPKENFFICTYESFFSDRSVLDSLLRFIGSNSTSEHADLRKKVYRGLGMVRKTDLITDTSGFEIVDQAGLVRLREIYSASVNKLGQDWNLDLTAWSDFQ